MRFIAVPNDVIMVRGMVSGTGVLLLVAAIAKATSGNLVVLGGEWQGGRGALVAFELLVGLFCLSPWSMTKWGLAVLIGLFGAFTLVAISRLGQDTCGCFGAIVVRPWITAGADLLVLAGLLSAWVLLGFSFSGEVWGGIATFSSKVMGRLTLAIGLATSLSMATYVGSMSLLASLQPDVVTLLGLPQREYEWVGHDVNVDGSYSFEDGITPISGLTVGTWIVLIHRAGCRVCEEAVEKFSSKLEVDTRRGNEEISGGMSWAMLEIVSHAGADQQHRGKLRKNRWIWRGKFDGQTPAVVLVVDGKVRRLISGREAIDPMAILQQ